LGFEWQVVTKSMTDGWIKRGIELSSAESWRTAECKRHPKN
jgi:hypothetical protein